VTVVGVAVVMCVIMLVAEVEGAETTLVFLLLRE
jgi:hypothetical protein